LPPLAVGARRELAITPVLRRPSGPGRLGPVGRQCHIAHTPLSVMPHCPPAPASPLRPPVPACCHGRPSLCRRRRPSLRPHASDGALASTEPLVPARPLVPHGRAGARCVSRRSTSAPGWSFSGALSWDFVDAAASSGTTSTWPQLTPARYLRDVRVITVKVGQF
jgi:hypothetical protein